MFALGHLGTRATIRSHLKIERGLSLQGVLFFNDLSVGGVHDELATARLALVILLAVVYMAIFLEVR